jgi:hypothetical protein
MGDGTVSRDDYATIFRSFSELPRSLAQFIPVARFRTVVDDRRRQFVGRRFVFDAIDAAISGGTAASGYVVIRGEPGVGKTAIAAAYAAGGQHVHHFNLASANIRTSAQLTENVCAQLIARYGLDHRTLPPDAGHRGEFLSQLLLEAADRARERDLGPVVIVVDALDEADDSGLAPFANRLDLPRSLPPGVFFVVTTRVESDDRLLVDHAAEIWIREEDPANQRDVAEYIHGFIGSHPDPLLRHIAEWGLSRQQFVELLAERSEGNFMYLVHVLPEIASGRVTGATLGDIHRLPHGLKAYYHRHWAEMKDADPERFKRLQRPVLCFLAISFEPVTTLDLAEWTAVEPGEVKAVIDEWRQFLNEDPDSRPPVFRIYHRSFAEFLDECENLAWYHDRIADDAIGRIPGFYGR